MKPASSARWQVEGLGLLALVALLVYFLQLSWRRWPDPVVDFGQQCYDVWRLSQGARIYHEFVWNYGPFSIYFNALIFRLFGPGIMVLATANLAIYALILALAYAAFRIAWGPLGTFVASAVFISVFSFSHLLGVGNYNYATPYAVEATHGMLLILVAAMLVARWCRQPSRALAFLIGLCGGLSAVIKPEFMLAMGALAVAAFGLRTASAQKLKVGEFAALLAGGVLPTAAFTAWFARTESLKSAFIDASQAWWLVLVNPTQSGSAAQGNFLGANHPGQNGLRELKATACALIVLAAICAIGWFAGRAWPMLLRLLAALAAGVLIWYVPMEGGWFEVGRCLPGLVLILFVVIALRVGRELKEKGKAEERTVMAFLLVLLAAIMLARMMLFARIYHFGFFQAALAGMVVAAAMVAELPGWCGSNAWGRAAIIVSSLVVLAAGCFSIALKSHKIRADQTEPVGWERDRFYATTRTMDGTGAVVQWAAERLRSSTPETTALVLPEGIMINYLARRKSIEPHWAAGETEEHFLQRLIQNPPDCVIFITRDLREFGITQFGANGQRGDDLVHWVAQNYAVDAGFGGDPLALDSHPGALFMKRKPK